MIDNKNSKEIWDFIHASYQNYDFDKFKYISGLGIISIDNYYLVSYYPDNSKVVTFKISIEHNIIKSTSSYIIDNVEFGFYVGSVDDVSSLVYEKLKPVIREVKLMGIGI